MRSRFSSHKPYTASRTSSGAVCFILYQRSHSARSWSRKSAERSTTFAPPSSSVRASFMATPWGVAKKTTSQPRSALASGAVKASATRPRRLGNIAATGVPASLREVIALSSTCGCCASSRRSSTPVYPVPPTMPALIMRIRVQKRESRPGAAFDPVKRPVFDSTFRVLLAPPRLVQTDFFSLDFARIARDEPGCAQDALQSGIILDQGARDAVAHRACLPAFAAAVDVHHDVEARLALGELERLAHYHAAGFAAEELVHRLAVHHEAALTGLQEHTRHGALAPPGAVVIVADHFRFLDLQGCRLLRRMRMAATRVDLELADHRVAERALGQHALHRALEHALGLRGMQLREIGLLDTAGESGMAVVDLALRLSSGDAQLRRVQHHNIIAGVDVRGVLGLVLAAQPRRDLRREAAQHLALGIHDHPAVLDLSDFCGIRSHARNCERVRILHKKMAQLARVAPNPPKEEGGGDNTEFRSDYAVAHVATQCTFWHFRNLKCN